MRSARQTQSRQRGASLIETVVASALMGIGVVVGLTAWDTAALSASRAVRIAWANCIVRAEMDAIMAAPFADDYEVPSQFSVGSGDGTVLVAVDPGRPTGVNPAGEEQQVTVQAVDPQAKSMVLAQVVVLKTRALQGGHALDNNTLTDLRLGCPAR